jgi:hypothetical protein
VLYATLTSNVSSKIDQQWEEELTPIGGPHSSNSTNAVTRSCQAASSATPRKYPNIEASHGGKLVEVTSPIITSSSALSSVDSGEMPEEEMDGVVGSRWAFEHASAVSGVLGCASAEVVMTRVFPPVPVTDGVVWADSVASTDTGEGEATESRIFFGSGDVGGLVGRSWFPTRAALEALVGRVIASCGSNGDVRGATSSAVGGVPSAPEGGFAGAYVVVSEPAGVDGAARVDEAVGVEEAARVNEEAVDATLKKQRVNVLS